LFLHGKIVENFLISIENISLVLDLLDRRKRCD
jgi:hypothetical protein